MLKPLFALGPRFIRRRTGVSLIEILICVVILGVLGAALTRLMLAQGRLADLQRAQRDARAIGRTSMNLLFSDLRMVHDGGDAPGSVLLASPETLKVRVPYAVGLVCGTSAAATTVSMLSADSATRYMSSYAGYAWRSRATNSYTYVPMGSPTNAPVVSLTPAVCTDSAKISTDTISGRSWPPIDLTPLSVAAGLQPGAPVFLYQEVQYWFGASTAYPGRIALWRQATGLTADELAAPFDASARFKFFQRASDTASVTPPVVLDSLVGVTIVLNGASPTSMAGDSPEKTLLETAVLFRNHTGF